MRSAGTNLLFINKLQIDNFRNLSRVSIKAHPKQNVLYGGNGAGKTSVLEALVVLSRGRSFRTTQAAELLGAQGKHFRIFIETENEQGARARMGLERTGSHWRARKDGMDLSQLSQLTRALPVVLMEPNSHLLVSGPPETRRKYLDWGMFHVEHDFMDVYRRYSKILKQRNAALRNRQVEVMDSIDDVLADLGVRIDGLRRAHTDSVSTKTRQLLKELSPGLGCIEFRYRKGWSGDTLRESLKINRDNDLQRGSTGSGPHRADVVMTFNDGPAKGVLSRGEQKILSAALLLSQADILKSCGDAPVMLMDDLASEFDERHFENVLEMTRQVGGQVWVTGTREYQSGEDFSLFHVEHGEVQEMV